MGLDGLRAEPEGPGDALVRAALRHQGEDLPLTRRECGEGIDPRCRVEQLVDDRAVDDALAGGNPLQGVEELCTRPTRSFIR